MSKYNFPEGYSLFQAIVRSVELMKDPLGVMTNTVKKFGKCYTIQGGFNSRFILTQDPEFIEYVLKKNHKNYIKSPIAADNLARFIGHGLLTSNGEYWLKQRRLIQPGFHVKKIQALYDIMGKTTDDFLHDFPVGEKIDVYPLMHTLAFKLVINTLFNIAIPNEVIKELGQLINEIQTHVVKDIRQPYTSWLRKLSGEEARCLKKSQRGRDIIQDIIETRKATDEKCDDLLDMLLDSRYEDTGEPMSTEQIIDEILIIIIAGHETTANALAWTLYLLASNPQALNDLRNNSSELGLEECATDELLASCVQESMRLYPPAWVSDRIAVGDDEFGKYKFPKGTIIALFFYGLHRDPDIWKDPLTFDLYRFTTPEAKKTKTKAYFPFGAGPRLCIGSHFAMAEMGIFLKKFIHAFNFESDGVEPAKVPLITLRPDKVVLKINKLPR